MDARRLRRYPAIVVTLVKRHRMLAAVLAFAATVRLATMIAYGPALFFSDSWSYLRMAWAGDPVQFAPDRPNGYSVLIEVLTPGRALVPMVGLQHLVGLVVAALVYVLARRADVPGWLSVAAAGFVALDAKAVAVHQHLLPEAFFTLALLTAAWLAVSRPHDVRALAAVGALLAGATLLRSAGVFAVPIFAAYLVWVRVGARGLAVAAVVTVVPLAAYGALLQSRWGAFGLTANDGWFLYGRVAEILRCEDLDLEPTQQRVCSETEAAAGAGAAYLIWDPGSPASRAYPGRGIDPVVQRRSNAELRDLARQAIANRPGAYAAMVARDVGRLFVPGEGSGTSDTAITLPRRPLSGPPAFNRMARDRLLPAYRPAARPPAAALHAYGTVVTAPRPLLAVALLLALAAVLRHTRRRREIFLLGGSGAAIAFGSVATSEFIVRYLVPAVPLLMLAGVIAAADLARGRESAEQKGREAERAGSLGSAR